LRSIAVCSVLVDHLFLTLHGNARLGTESQMYYMTALGHAGVLAFFVHTSFVLMNSLERMHKTKDRVTFPFYVRRFFRIYPLAITTILIVLAFHVPYKTYDHPGSVSRAGVIANFFLMQNIFTKEQVLSPMWSLPYEVQMYAVLPFLFVLASRKKSVFQLTALILLCSVFGAIMSLKTGHLNMLAYVPCFLAGVLCYSLRKFISPTISSYLWIPFLLILFGVFVLANPGEAQTFWSGWIFCLMLGVSINAFADVSVRSINVVAGKTALYSYGMYLLHSVALYVVFFRLRIGNLIVASFIFFALTIVASMIAFHAIESPFIELGRWLSSPARGRVLTEVDVRASIEGSVE